MSIKKGLGRGFDSLLPTDLLDEEFDPTARIDEKVSELRYVFLQEIHPDPDQPRRYFDESAIEDLTQSIREHGILQPLIVMPDKKGFMIVAGERRYRAAQKANLPKVPVIVRTLTNQHKLELSLIENLQRQDLNPLETATAYVKLRDQFNLSLKEISKRVGGKSVAVISNMMRLLHLPPPAKQALIAGLISEGHARQILALTQLQTQKMLLDRIVAEQWSVRRAEQFVIGYKKGGVVDKVSAAKRATVSETPLTLQLSKQLQTPVKVRTTANGGQLIITYRDEKDLQRIARTIVSSGD